MAKLGAGEFVAVPRDIRLLNAAIEVKQDALKASAARSNGQISVNARCSAQNTVEFGSATKNDGVIVQLLLVYSDLTVEVTDKIGGATLIEMKSKHVGLFETFPNDLNNENPLLLKSPAIAPSMATVNQFAVRNAEVSISSTGVAALRLNVPDVTPKSLSALAIQRKPRPATPMEESTAVKKAAKRGREQRPK